MTIWYTSDSHFRHENIIKYSNRPFKHADEMDECLIERWNEVVKPEDHVWHLGDVTMMRSANQRWDLYGIIRKLNGHKRLILGNHDHFPVSVYIEAGFEKIKASWVHDNLLLTHIPVHPDSLGRFGACVHGHTHNNCYPAVVKEDDKGYGKHRRVVPYVNICVEQTNYRPISLEEVKERVRQLKGDA